MKNPDDLKLKELSDGAWEGVSSAHHWGDGFTDAARRLHDAVKTAYRIGRMRQASVSTIGGQRAWTHFEREYGDVCDELAFAICEAERAEPELFNSNSDTCAIMASVRWVFCCEWDDDLDHWYEAMTK